MNCCLKFITVILVQQLYAAASISEKNWFFNGSKQHCKNYSNTTKLENTLAPVSRWHINTTSFYLTNISDTTQNLNLSLYTTNTHGSNAKGILDIGLEFRNNFNDLQYCIQMYHNGSENICGIIPLPYLHQSVLLEITLNVYIDSLDNKLILFANTNGAKGKKIWLLEVYFYYLMSEEKIKNLVWTSIKSNTCAVSRVHLEATKLPRY